MPGHSRMQYALYLLRQRRALTVKQTAYWTTADRNESWMGEEEGVDLPNAGLSWVIS